MSDSARSSEPILSLRNVGLAFKRRISHFRWGDFWALKDVSLDLFHGESLGIVGRNGAGKTTLLRVIAGIYKPDRGQILRNGLSASILSLNVGFSPLLSGRENAILSGLLQGLRREQIESCIPDIIEFSGLGDFFDEPLLTYSSGMRARLGFSVAMNVDPDILLLDEVLGVGDVEFKEKSAEALRQKILSDKSVVLVSHSPNRVRKLCDRLVWIEDGQTRATGAVDDILGQYEEYIKAQRKAQKALR